VYKGNIFAKDDKLYCIAVSFQTQDIEQWLADELFLQDALLYALKAVLAILFYISD